MHTKPSTDEIRAWLRLTLEPGIGAVHARQLLAAIGLPQHIYDASSATLSKHVPAEMAAQLRREPTAQTQELIERTLEWLAQPGHHLLTLADPAYPAALLDTHDPPTALYVNGGVELLNMPTISVVGARSATPGGLDNARSFSRHLAQQGWCIASGLAQGIDTAAHQGALEAGAQAGSTLAVMGTGIDIVFPAANLQLAHQIAAQGALVSELPLGTPSVPHQFPRRNRIVAGLAKGVLVVEAAQKSGSLITARLASELGRDVFAIPGSIHSPLSRGCHALIRQGAKLVESGQDIHEELGSPHARQPALHPEGRPGMQNSEQHGEFDSAQAKRSSKPQGRKGPGKQSSGGGQASLFPPGTPESRVMDALGHDPVDADTLQSRTGLDTADLGGLLLRLELEDALYRLDDGRYQRRG